MIHNDDDFFENNKGDIIVSNPPFSLKKDVFKRLVELDKPFIMLCSQNLIFTQYFRNILDGRKFQILIPRRRIQFIKLVNGEIVDTGTKCNFDCYFYCYKMNLERDIIFLS